MPAANGIVAPPSSQIDRTRGRFNRGVVSILAFTSLASAVILYSTATRFDSAQVLGLIRATLVVCIPLLALSLYGRAKHLSRLGESGMLLVWLWIANVAFVVPILAVARLCFPLQDFTFLAIDRWCGVSISVLASWTAAHPVFHSLMAWTYDSLRICAAAAIAFLLFRSDFRRVRLLILSGVIALFIATAVSAVIPGIGPWVVDPIAPSAQQVLCQTAILKARSPGPGVLDLSNAKIICFPSFHVCLALLTSAIFGASCKRMRLWALAWAGLVALSAMALAWHYFCDAVGGGLLAYCSIRLAEKIMSQPDC